MLRCAIHTLIHVCKQLDVPLEPGKQHGPTTSIVVLGILIDTRAVCRHFAKGGGGGGGRGNIVFDTYYYSLSFMISCD